MINICIDARFIVPKFDGIGRYIFNLIENLSELTESDTNFLFTILELEQFSNNSILRKLDYRNNLKFVEIPVKPLTLRNHFISNFLKEFKINLYHYPQFDLPWFINIPAVATIHDLNPQKFSNFFREKGNASKKYYSIITNYLTLRKSKAVISISNSTKNELLNYYGKKFEKKINVIYEGVSGNLLESFNVKDKKTHLKMNDLKKKYNFDKYILYVGNNRFHKNLERVLKAFSELKKNCNNIEQKFLFAGEHLQGYTDIISLSKKLNVQNEVIKLSCNDQILAELYFNCDAFIYCSLSEGFGLPILEAMQFGVPVLTSNLSSMKEISGDAALLVDPYSIDEIRSGMLKILTDRELRNKLSGAGRKKVNLFSWKKCARHTLELYISQLK